MYTSMEALALRNAQEFITPKTRLENLSTLLAIFWLLMAFIPAKSMQELRAFFFFSMLLIILLAVFQKLARPEMGSAGRGFQQASLRSLLIYLPIEFFGQNTKHVLEDWAGIRLENIVEITTYSEVEHWGVLVLLAAGLLATSTDRKLLEEFKIVDFVLLLFRGIFLAFLTIFAAIELKFVKIEGSSSGLFLVSLISYIHSGMGPSRLGLMQIATAGSLPNVPPSSRIEGLRDSIILGALMILFFDLVLQWLEGPFWVETAVILFAVGMVIQVLVLQRGLNPLDFLGSQNLLAQRFDSVNNSLQQFQTELVDGSANLTQRDVFSVKDDVELLKKADTTLSVEKDALLLPLSETDQNVSLMVVGKGKLQTKENQAANAESEEFEQPLTLTLPREEWEEIKGTKGVVPTSFSEEALAKVGSSKEALANSVGESLTHLKKLGDPRKAISDLVPATSRYGISDTKEGTSVSLPGLRVIERKGLTHVKLPGIEVLDFGSAELVSLPFIKVMSTKQVEVVHTPLFSVVETPKGEMVKILGFTIREGDLDEDELQKTIQESLNQFQVAKETMGLKTAASSSLLLTSSSDGPKMKLLAGEQTTKGEEELPGFPTEGISGESKATKRERKRKAKRKYRRERKRRKREKEAEPEAIPAESVTLEAPSHLTFETVERAGETVGVPVCELCNEPITTVSTACPFCGSEFHKDHWQGWIRKRGKCPVCDEKVKVISP
ncbi:MAG: RING finger protein [Candidatus Heimdallarchaeota archaeon]